MPLTESQTRYVNFYTDFAFKKLFGTEANKALLLSFLNSRFEGKERFVDITYLNTEHLGELDERPAELKEAIFNQLFETAEIAKYTPQERMDYEESLKNFRDWYSVITTAEKKGKAEGHAEGMQKGKAEGRAEGILSTALKLKQMGMTAQMISEATGLSEEEIAVL